MGRGKAKDTKSWERLLGLMVNGGPFTKEMIADNIDYDYMYRLSSLIFEIKIHGGTVKVVKEGRKVVSYELVNIDTMTKYLTNKGFAPMQVKSKKASKPKKVEKLVDLQAEQVSADVATAEVDVVEVTEVTQ